MPCSRRAVLGLALLLSLTLLAPAATVGAEPARPPSVHAVHAVIDWIVGALLDGPASFTRLQDATESGPDADPDGLVSLPLPTSEETPAAHDHPGSGDVDPDADPDG